MRANLLVFFAAVAALHTAGAAEIRRCISPTGESTFTNLPCPSSSRAEHVADYEPVPDSKPDWIDPDAYAAAESARHAQAAARDAEAAADAARYAYEEAAARAQNAQNYDSGYSDVYYPYTTGYGGNFRGRGHGRGDHVEHHDHGHGRTHETGGGGLVVQQSQNVGGRETLLSRTAIPQAQVQPPGFTRHR